jgi:hypothetical protein
MPGVWVMEIWDRLWMGLEGSVEFSVYIGSFVDAWMLGMASELRMMVSKGRKDGYI